MVKNRKIVGFYTDKTGKRRPITKGSYKALNKSYSEGSTIKHKTLYVDGETPHWINNLIDKLDEVDECTWFGKIDGRWVIVIWSPKEGEPTEQGWWTIIEFDEPNILDAKGQIKDLLLLTLFDYAAKSYLNQREQLPL
jgi:hypothetical protein